MIDIAWTQYVESQEIAVAKCGSNREHHKMFIKLMGMNVRLI